MVASLLAATVYAIPIRESSTETQNRLNSKLQPRDPVNDPTIRVKSPSANNNRGLFPTPRIT